MFLIMTFVFASCRQLDVIGNKSITSFKEVLDAIPDKISANEVNGGWTLIAPDNSARFFWSNDFSKSKIYDVMIEFDVKPFIDAGLEIDKLPEGMVFGDKLVVGTDLSSENLTYDGEVTPLASYEKIVELKRESIGYHTALDHFGVDLSGGNMFEWAKDLGTNDKDIVFVLNPKVFIDAGVDPEKSRGGYLPRSKPWMRTVRKWKWINF
ncbi:hypothetical protein JCM21531_1252 [Acetivibrio straminisolvens JCM 21531]|uniref:Uncharacterized protein n=2 Tax=Acetivibrio straminisolvens TaxID=253314 RepID=W4V313_9FIRM|nr:hypothetical protein JCM21531_1252 [Acetivibrio straminisolvens JCM 21531]